MKRLAVVALFYAALTTYFTWPLAARLSSGLSDSPDTLLNFWALSWSFHTLPRDPSGFFHANIFFPRPDTLAYSEHLFGVTLLAWPFYLASGKVVFAYNAALALTFVLSGTGMYLLALETFGTWRGAPPPRPVGSGLSGSRLGALAAGVIYAFAPYRFLHVLHLQLLSCQWFPFVFLYFFRFLRDGRPRQAAAAGAFALLQILSCNYYALFLALALGLAVVARAPALFERRKLAWAAGTGATVALVALPFFLPYERNRSEKGFYRRYEDVVQFSAKPSDYLRPSAFNAGLYRALLPAQERSEKALFPGFLALALGAVGLVRPERRSDALFFGGLVAAAFVLSLGPQIGSGDNVHYLPYRFFYRHVPGFSGLRVPARLGVLVLFGLSALAARGFTALRLKGALGVAALGLSVIEYRTDSLARVFSPAPEGADVYRWLAREPGDFAVVELPMHEGEEITRESIRMYHATTHWKRLANGYSGWWPNDYWELVGRMRSFPDPRSLRFLDAHVPVRLVVIHYGEMAPEDAERVRQAITRHAERLPLRARFGQDDVHELLPPVEAR